MLSHSLLSCFLVNDGVAAEEQRDAPERGEADQRVDHAADGGGLSAEEPRDEIKAEQPDAAPVDAADDKQREGDAIHEHRKLSSPCGFLVIMPFEGKKYAFDKTSVFSLFTKRADRSIV